MRIVLPSQGVLGCKEVELALPRYSHLRALTEISYNEEEIGFAFVRSLLADPGALAQMTFRDKDYLLAIAVASLHMNVIKLKACCSCGEVVQVDFDLAQQEVIDLETPVAPVIKKSLNNEEYSYHFLSATDEQEIVRWAKQHRDMAPSDRAAAVYQQSYEEGLITRTFGFDLTEDNVRRVSDFNILVFYSALLFQEMSFHGVRPFVEHQCPKCGKPMIVVVPFAKSLMRWSSNDIINDFMSVSQFVGFESFLDLTFAELAQMRANMDTM